MLTENIYEVPEGTNQSEVLKNNDEEKDVLKNLKTSQEVYFNKNIYMQIFVSDLKTTLETYILSNV